jgi:hypothetical protein
MSPASIDRLNPREERGGLRKKLLAQRTNFREDSKEKPLSLAQAIRLASK